MHKIALLLAALPCALVVSSCSAPLSSSSLSYQFSDPNEELVCLEAPARGEEMLALQVRRALQKKHLQIRDIDTSDLSTCSRSIRYEAMYSADNRTLRLIRLELDRTGQEPFRVEAELPSASERGVFSQNDDYFDEVRGLVDRLFPDPVRWSTY